MDLLAVATTALRDKYMGIPDDEIVALSGMGMKTLLRDLVAYLRENGVDDEGGLDCDETKDIQVLHHPRFEPFTLVVGARATDEFGDSPRWAEITVDQAFAQTLERLRRVCQENALESLAVSGGPDRWDQEESLRMSPGSLLVTPGEFWFEAWPKLEDYSVQTLPIRIDGLLAIAELLAKSGRFEYLPTGFRIRDGVVFYDNLNPDDLDDSYRGESGAA